jgi:hypothetical protein
MRQVCIILFGLSGIFGYTVNAQIVPFDSDRWTIESESHVIVGYEGVENALFLNNGVATLKDVQFVNGTIEFDIYLAERRGFPGVMFRMQDRKNYEEFYLRPHLSGMPDAMQYTPVDDGNSSWQLFHDQAELVQDGRVSFSMKGGHGYNTVYNYPYDRWLHVKLVIAGTRAEIYFDRSDEPALQIRELKRPVNGGGLGIKTGVSPFYFANFSYSVDNQSELQPAPTMQSTQEHSNVPEWQVGGLLMEKELLDVFELTPDMLDGLSWSTSKSDASGLVNLSAMHTRPDRTHNTTFAKITIAAESEMLRALNIGYSDRVRIYCNGRMLYSGSNTYLSRDYRYLGTIGYFDTVVLPLKKGRNEIIFAVSETFGGWGVQARMPDASGITFVK